MIAEHVDKMVKQLILKDLRVQCRVRGVSPAGSKETLEQRLKEHMFATNDL
jgi:SPIRAL1-like protein